MGTVAALFDGALAVLNNILWIVVGLVIPFAWSRVRRYQKLKQIGQVFPLTAEEDEDQPTIHVRASLDVLPYGENPPTLRGYTHSGDVLSVMRITEHFQGLPVKVKFDYFPEIAAKMRNVVLLGASSRSDVCREVAGELYKWGIRVRGEGHHAYFMDDQGQQFHCEHVEVGGMAIVSKDVGVIFRRKTESGSTVLMCGGVHTFGSLAATEVALSRDFQRKIRRRKLGEFVQFVTVDVITSGDRAGLGIARQSIRWEGLPLIDVRKLG